MGPSENMISDCELKTSLHRTKMNIYSNTQTKYADAGEKVEFVRIFFEKLYRFQDDFRLPLCLKISLCATLFDY